MYEIFFTDEAVEQLFFKIDKSERIKIYKKIKKLKNLKKRRHLKFGLSFFVEEMGQYRVVYENIEEKKIININFIGNHKDYEKFLGSLLQT